MQEPQREDVGKPSAQNYPHSFFLLLPASTNTSSVKIGKHITSVRIFMLTTRPSYLQEVLHLPDLN